MNNIKLPPDVEFFEDIRLIVWRPHGLVNKAAVNKVITILGELETAFKEPFNRFSDTVAADAVDLNFEYIIRFSLSALLLRQTPADQIGDSRHGCYPYSLRQGARLTNSRFSNQCPRIPGSQRRRAMARCTNRNSSGGRGPALVTQRPMKVTT
jgi:hypothetical protein